MVIIPTPTTVPAMSAYTAVVVVLLVTGYCVLHRPPPVPPAQGGCRPHYKAVEQVFR